MDNNIVLVRALRERGLNSYDIRRMAQRAELVAVRRGAYVVDRPDDQSVEQAHRDLIRATVPQLDDGAVISHGSAAVLHGLPTWSSALSRVHVTRDRSGGGRRRPVVHVHGAPLTPDELTVIDGVTATSMARTVLDLGRTLPMEQAVAA